MWCTANDNVNIINNETLEDVSFVCASTSRSQVPYRLGKVMILATPVWSPFFLFVLPNLRACCNSTCIVIHNSDVDCGSSTSLISFTKSSVKQAVVVASPEPVIKFAKDTDSGTVINC